MGKIYRNLTIFSPLFMFQVEELIRDNLKLSDLSLLTYLLESMKMKELRRRTMLSLRDYLISQELFLKRSLMMNIILTSNIENKSKKLNRRSNYFKLIILGYLKLMEDQENCHL